METASSQYVPTSRRTVLGALFCKMRHCLGIKSKGKKKLSWVSQNVSLTSVISTSTNISLDVRWKWIGTGLCASEVKLYRLYGNHKLGNRNTVISKSSSLLSNHAFLLGWCVSVSYVWHGIYTGIVSSGPSSILAAVQLPSLFILAASLDAQTHTLSTVGCFCKSWHCAQMVFLFLKTEPVYENVIDFFRLSERNSC